MAFKHNQILSTFKGVRAAKNSGMWQYCYIFSSKKTGSDYLEIYASDDDKDFQNEIRILVDNFPSQRRSYHTNIPFKSIEDFEHTLERINVEVPERLVIQKCKNCNNDLPKSYFKKSSLICKICNS